MLIYGPSFVVWRNKTFCSLMFSGQAPKMIQLLFSPIDELSRPTTIDIETGKSSANLQVAPGLSFVLFEVEKLFGTGRVPSGLCLYNFKINGKAVLEPTSLKVKKHVSAFAKKYELIGPASVLSDKRNVTKWVFASCNDVSQRKSAAPGLKLKVESLITSLTNHKKKSRAIQQLPGLGLIGDQIYTDSLWDPRNEYKQLGLSVLREVAPRLAVNRIFSPNSSDKVKNRNSKSKVIHPLEYLAYFIIFYGRGLDFTGKVRRDEVSNFGAGLAKMRLLSHISNVSLTEVLAHLPVVFQWDDHDVVDDWNLTKQWATMYANKRVVEDMLPTLVLFQAPYAFLQANNRNMVREIYDSFNRFAVGVKPRQLSEKSRKRIQKKDKGSIEKVKLITKYNYCGNTLFIENRLNRVYRKKRTQEILELVTTRENIANNGGLTYVQSYREVGGYFDSLATFKNAFEEVSSHLASSRRTTGNTRFKNLVIPSPIFALPDAEFVQKRLARSYSSIASLETWILDSRLAKKYASEIDPEPWGLYETDLPEFMSYLGRKDVFQDNPMIIGGDVHYSYAKEVEIFSGNKKPLRVTAASASPLALYKKGILPWQKAQPFFFLRALGLLDVKDQISAEEERYYYTRSDTGLEGCAVIGIASENPNQPSRQGMPKIKKKEMVDYLGMRLQSLDKEIIDTYYEMAEQLVDASKEDANDARRYNIIVLAHNRVDALLEQKWRFRSLIRFVSSADSLEHHIRVNKELEPIRRENSFTFVSKSRYGSDLMAYGSNGKPLREEKR